MGAYLWYSQARLPCQAIVCLGPYIRQSSSIVGIGQRPHYAAHFPRQLTPVPAATHSLKEPLKSVPPPAFGGAAFAVYTGQAKRLFIYWMLVKSSRLPLAARSSTKNLAISSCPEG